MLSAFNSQKFRFWSFVSMALLVFVHGYNLNQGYLQPWTMPGEPLTATTFIEYWLANGIFRFRIPMLFIISGYLFAMHDELPYASRVRKRIKTLLYPYLFWSAFALLFTYVLEFFSSGKAVVVASNLMRMDQDRILLSQYYWYELAGRWLFFPVAYQLWFIRVLFIYNLAYPALRWCVTHPTARWIFFTFAILFWISTGGLILFEGEGLLFFSIGIWMRKTSFNIDKPNQWLKPKIWFIVFILLSVLKTILAFADPFQGIEILLLLMHKTVVISGLISAWYGFNKAVKYFMNREWFKWLTSFSFMIYVLHAPAVVYATKAVFIYMPHYYNYRIITYILLPLCLIVLSLITGVLLRKLLPGAYSFITGCRGLS